MLRKITTTMAAAIFVTLAVVFAVAAPAFAQGLATVEPTLAECRAFVGENGVPETRPVWENRGYSGWDVCLSMAYDGDLDGYFASSDANGDGKLDASEQSAYMDSVIGPVSDPDQSPLTLDKCAAIISRHGMPAERPFEDWTNRGYGEIEICQSLSFDGDLDVSFAAADKDSDGRLDRSEQKSYMATVSRDSSEVAPETPGDEPTSGSQDESAVRGQYGTNAAEEQYENTDREDTGLEETTTPPTEPTTSGAAEGEPTASVQPDDATGAAQTPETAQSARTDEPEKGVLSAVNDAVRRLLPETGGVSLLGILGGAVLIASGFLAYRFIR